MIERVWNYLTKRYAPVLCHGVDVGCRVWCKYFAQTDMTLFKWCKKYNMLVDSIKFKSKCPYRPHPAKSWIKKRFSVRIKPELRMVVGRKRIRKVNINAFPFNFSGGEA